MAAKIRNIRFRKKKPKRGLFFVFVVLIILVGLFYCFRLYESKKIEAVKDVHNLSSNGSTDSTLMFSSDGSVRKILEIVLKIWIDSIISNDFTLFHQIISSPWQNQDSPQKLAESFKNLITYRSYLEYFPERGKLVLLASRPFEANNETGEIIIRDNIGPESPWLVKGEWRSGKTTLGFTLILSLENAKWRPSGLSVEMYE
jgi:hypothetical protein